jgi:hypothetical protein
LDLQDEQWEKILDLILKVKNLKEHPGSEGEAVAASEALQRLMFKYGVTSQDLANKQGRDKKGRFQHTTFNFGTKTKWLTGWKAVLLQGLAKCYFCRSLYDEKQGIAVLVGEERSIRVVNELMDHLTKYIRLECNTAWRLQEIKHTAKRREIKFRIGFYHGAVDRILTRIEDQRRQIELEMTDSTSTALVIQTDKELDDEMQKYLIRPSRKHRVDGHAFAMGQITGQNAKIQEELN